MSDRVDLDAHRTITSWIDEYGDDMYSWAVYKTSSKETAEDLVQETLISAFRSFDKYRPGTNPKTWLFTILGNKIIDHYRASHTNRSVNQSTLMGSDPIDENFSTDGLWKHSPISPWAEKEEHLLDDPAFLKVLDRCIDALPERWRQVVLGKYMEHKKGKQISKELGITSSNLWQMVHRAKLQLKSCLDTNWEKE